MIAKEECMAIQVIEITEKEYIVGVTNSLGDLYKAVRSASKAPTFALT